MTWIEELISLGSLFESVACVGLPRVAQRMVDAGQKPVILGLEAEFDFIQGFRPWDLERPVYIEPTFDCVIANMENVGTPQAFDSVRILSQFRFDTAIVLVHEADRLNAVRKVFEPFSLVETTLETESGLLLSSNWELV